MDPRSEDILVWIHEYGPQTERDLRRAHYNYNTTQSRLDELERAGHLMRDQREDSDKPGRPQPYHLTERGEKKAAEVLAFRTNKLITPSREIIEHLDRSLAHNPPLVDGLTIPLTGYTDGKFITTTIRTRKKQDLSDPEKFGLIRRALSTARIITTGRSTFSLFSVMPSALVPSMPSMPSLPSLLAPFGHKVSVNDSAVAVKDISIPLVPMDPIITGPVLPRFLAPNARTKATEVELAELEAEVERNTVAVVAEYGTDSYTLERAISKLKELNVDPRSVSILRKRSYMRPPRMEYAGTRSIRLSTT